ncbi:MAG: LuxR C-terminal-related transcriptional regulator [Bacteroidetes bacterium]|nr:LuxR C-terminal-related transcriptional regulator [Bacteroidota bacterium]
MTKKSLLKTKEKSMGMIIWDSNIDVKTSERENEVIRYIAKGTRTKEIAEKMRLSIYTVRAHKRNIFEKTKTSNIAELTSYAFENRII